MFMIKNGNPTLLDSWSFYDPWYIIPRYGTPCQFICMHRGSSTINGISVEGTAVEVVQLGQFDYDYSFTPARFYDNNGYYILPFEDTDSGGVLDFIAITDESANILTNIDVVGFNGAIDYNDYSSNVLFYPDSVLDFRDYINSIQ